MKKWWIAGLVLAVLVAVLSPLASSDPDGLERVAEDQGFAESAREAPFSLVADYLFPGIENESIATILAGILGTVLMFGVALGIGRLLRPRRSEQS